jgi:arylformamidase
MYYRGYNKADLDIQYNMRVLLPDFQQYFDKWESWSDRARNHLNGKLDVAYGNGFLEKLDIFNTARPNTPVHVFIHGGYWMALDKSNFSYIAEVFVSAGATSVILNYGLAPAAKMDQIVRQTREGLAWVWRHISEFGGDPSRIYIDGHSAGGHLVAMLMVTNWPEFAQDLPKDLIKGGLAVSGLFDLEPIRLCYLNETLGMDQKVAFQNSPIHSVPEAAPPLILSVGGLETDELRRHSYEFAWKWRAQGLSLDVVDMAHCQHYTIYDERARPDSPLNHAILKHMGLARG